MRKPADQRFRSPSPFDSVPAVMPWRRETMNVEAPDIRHTASCLSRCHARDERA